MSDNQDPSQYDLSHTNGPSQDEKNIAMLCHLGAFAQFIIPFGGIIVPLVIWQMKKGQSSYIEHHAKESLNFQITMFIAFICAALLIFVLIGIPLLIGLAVFEVVMMIVAGIKASEGQYYRYPFCLRLVD